MCDMFAVNVITGSEWERVFHDKTASTLSEIISYRVRGNGLGIGEGANVIIRK